MKKKKNSSSCVLMTARHCARRSATAATLRCRHPPRGGATLEESDNERVIARRLEDATTTNKERKEKNSRDVCPCWRTKRCPRSSGRTSFITFIQENSVKRSIRVLEKKISTDTVRGREFGIMSHKGIFTFDSS